MRQNPFQDAAMFLTKASWLTVPFWLLLLGSIAIAWTAWRRYPSQRSARHLAVWLARCFVGVMWWQQSLWKVPPDYGGLVYWMQQMVDHSAFALQSDLVRDIAIPRIGIFGPLQYAVEVAIAASLALGALTRLSSAIGFLMAVNLWLGLYNAPHEWPWTYFFLILIEWLFMADPPGRSLGLEALGYGRVDSWGRVRMA